MKLSGNNGIQIHCNLSANAPISFASADKLNQPITCIAKIAQIDANTVITTVENVKVNKYADFTRSYRFAL